MLGREYIIEESCMWLNGPTNSESSNPLHKINLVSKLQNGSLSWLNGQKSPSSQGNLPTSFKTINKEQIT